MDKFYREFEESNYASYEHIKILRRQYAPILNEIASTYPESKALDIGCGRGEWLDILTEYHFKAYGIDIDEGMLQEAQIRGFHCECGDAIDYLKSLDSASHSIISAFHVVEHLEHEQLKILISESHRVLKNGGVLIFETPDSENITVGTDSFYLDPTHKKPIPKGLLSHMVRFFGFTTTDVVRLNGSHFYSENINIKLNDVIFGVNPDYAVIGFKGEEKNSQRESLKSLKDSTHGHSLNDLIDRFNTTIETRLISIESKNHKISDENNSMREDISELISKFEELNHKVENVNVFSLTKKAIKRILKI